MDPEAAPERERAWLREHADAAVAWGHGRRWCVDFLATSEHRAPAASRPAEPADDDAGAPTVYVPRLVPVDARSRRFAGSALRGWGILWMVVLTVGGLLWSSHPGSFIALAGAGLLATMVLPGWLLRLTARVDRRVILPLEVLRDRPVHDGLHALELRDVGGTSVHLVATPTLATALLLSSDFDGSTVFTGGRLATASLSSDSRDPGGTTGTLASAADVSRRREGVEIDAAAALVNPRLPAALYPPELVEPHLAEAARVAGVDRATLEGRIAALASEVASGDEEDLSTPLLLHTTSAATAAMAFAMLGWVPILILANRAARSDWLHLPWS